MNRLILYLICIYIFILPLFPGKFSIKGIPLNGDIIMFLIIFIYFIGVVFCKKSRERFRDGLKNFFSTKTTLFMFMWILMMYVSILYAVDKKLALGESIRMSTYLIIFFIIKFEINKKEYLNRIIYSVCFSSILVGGVGIYKYLKEIYIHSLKHINYYVRIASTMENSNNLGAFFILIVFPFMILAFNEKNKFKKFIFSLTTCIGIVNILFCFSRNAWLGFILGYIILIFIYNKKLIYGALVGGGTILCIPKLFSRLKQVGDMSQNLSRISLWEIALKMIKDHPVLGVGNGNYRTLYSKYFKEVKFMGYTAKNKFHPHDIYLKAQCELGIVGLVSLVGFLLTSLLRINKIRKEIQDNFYKSFCTGVTASIGAFLFMNVLDNFFSAPKVIAFFFIFLAVCDSYYNICKESKESLYLKY